VNISISDVSNNLTGDITQRLCTVAEVKAYFSSITEKVGSARYMKPNRNCNLTSWVSGCEPGWACSTGLDQQVDLRDSQDIPARTSNCQACCEGFFCPHGITCMIRKCLIILEMLTFLNMSGSILCLIIHY